MILRPEQIQLLALGLPPIPANGGGDSSSSSSQTTQNVDRRQVVDSGSIGVSSDASTVHVTLNALDQGAVAGALELARLSDQNTAKNVQDVLGFARDVFVAGIGVIDKAGRQIEAQTGLLAQAYEGARGEGTQKNLVAAAAIAAVAMVAVKHWGRG